MSRKQVGDVSERGCRNTQRVGCPDAGAKLICFRPQWHGGDCYDAQEAIWWRPKNAAEPEPPLFDGVMAEIGRRPREKQWPGKTGPKPRWTA